MLKMTAKSQKLGNSYGVLLPKEILGTATLNQNGIIELLADGTGIKIQKINKIETLDELFMNFEGSKNCTEFDTGEPIGKEVW